MNGLNLSNIQDAKLGSTQVSALYYGSTKIWENAPDYSSQYLTIESLENNNDIYFETVNSDKTSLGKSIEYSTDLTNWISVTDEWEENAYPFIILSQGQKVYLRGTNSKYATSSSVYDEFYCTKNFSLSGNIMSLIYGSNFIGQTILYDTYTFACMFRNNASRLRSITNLILPATTLARYCYQYMFYGCTGLTTGPRRLPATSVGYYSYANMFQGCTSLVTPPVLCGITLGGYAYQSMFAGCTSLTTLPRLADGTTITSWAPYRQMFSGCTGITDARYDVNGDRLLPTHLTVSSGGSAYELMFQNCTNLQYAPELTDMNAHHGEYNQMFKGCTSLYSIITHASSLGTANFGAIVENTGHQGTVYKAKDVTWDTSQYSQFNYTSGNAWNVVDGDYNSGQYQT